MSTTKSYPTRSGKPNLFIKFNHTWGKVFKDGQVKFFRVAIHVSLSNYFSRNSLTF